jgi:hypothetical protein
MALSDIAILYLITVGIASHFIYISWMDDIGRATENTPELRNHLATSTKLYSYASGATWPLYLISLFMGNKGFPSTELVVNYMGTQYYKAVDGVFVKKN